MHCDGTTLHIFAREISRHAAPLVPTGLWRRLGCCPPMWLRLPCPRVPGHRGREAVALPAHLALESSPHFLGNLSFGVSHHPCRPPSTITSETFCTFPISWLFCSNPLLPGVQFSASHLCSPIPQSPIEVRDPLSPPQQALRTLRA